MKKPHFEKHATLGELYGPAMEIDNEADARLYLEALIEYCVEKWGKSRHEADTIQRANLGYYAGYYDNTTRERVERLFGCAHPIFGKISENGAPSMQEAFAAGLKAAQNTK